MRSIAESQNRLVFRGWSGVSSPCRARLSSNPLGTRSSSGGKQRRRPGSPESACTSTICPARSVPISTSPKCGRYADQRTGTRPDRIPCRVGCEQQQARRALACLGRHRGGFRRIGGRHVSAGEFSGDALLDSEDALDGAAKALRANAGIAIDLLRRADAPNAGLLIDVWHFYNGGGRPDQLVDLPTAGITAVQLNDGPRTSSGFGDR
jgi:hypothetical protein